MNIDDLVGLAPVVFIVLSVLWQVFTRANRAGGQRPGAPREAPKNLDEAGEQIREELSEFLRRFSGKKPADQDPQRPNAPAFGQRPAPSTQPMASPKRAPELPKQPRKRATGDRGREAAEPIPQRGKLSRPLQAEVVKPVPNMKEPVTAQVVESPEKRQVVAEHVKQYLDPRAIGDRSKALTTLDQADEQMESHIQNVFAHKLGRLDSAIGSGTGSAEGPQSLANELANMLRSRQGMQRAIVLQEILTRPEHRW